MAVSERSPLNRHELLQARKREKLRRERHRKMLIRRIIILSVPVLLIAVILVVVITSAVSCSRKRNEKAVEATTKITENTDSVRPHPEEAHIRKPSEPEYPYANRNKIVDGMIQVGDTKFIAGYTAEKSSSFIYPPEEISQSTYSILIDAGTGSIIAGQNEKDRMYPASMTKVMTLLVAAEHIRNLDDTVYVSQEAADYSYSQGGSAVNWSVGEKVTVKDLLYGTILSSGADACYDLAMYVSGSLDDFVDLMNAKAVELGISGSTHFTNCVGFYNDDHYTTVYDMAMIMKAAAENDLCREVMSAHTYTTPLTEEHPEGILISNWFLRRIEDKETKGEVLCAKTGFVNESGNCAVSYMISDSGVPYLCCTGHAHSAWRAIYDHVGLYYNYTH